MNGKYLINKKEILIKECEERGIEVSQRWEKGTPHHESAVLIFKFLKEADYFFGDDYFEWKEGGDGDNGETLMHSLSCLFELRDSLREDPLNIRGLKENLKEKLDNCITCDTSIDQILKLTETIENLKKQDASNY